MKEKPIIFKPEMVKAILQGVKTQTRRISRGYENIMERQTDLYSIGVPEGTEIQPIEDAFMDKCPYKVGDILWVRETWNEMACHKPECKSKCPLGKNCPGYTYKSQHFGPDIKWKPSIFMPRKAAHLFLEVKSVRIEKLQKITPEDCVNEGAVKKPHYMTYGGESYLAIHGRYKTEFAKLWDSINAKRGYSWESDPWVYVIEFIRLPDGGKK